MDFLVPVVPPSKNDKKIRVAQVDFGHQIDEILPVVVFSGLLESGAARATDVDLVVYL